jgi:hypothetical protein
MSRFNAAAAVREAIGDRTHAPDRVRGEYRARGLPLDPFCPTCGAPECHPTQSGVLVRGFKVNTGGDHWWSQCLVCASASAPGGGYDAKLNWTAPLSEKQREGGWF